MKDAFHARVYIAATTGTTFWACQLMETVMSRKWFVLTGRSTRNIQRDPLADPLEQEEWRGLGWLVPLLSWLVSSHDPARPHPARRPVAGRRALAQTRTPFLTR
jgi:hypothetical protein